MLELDHLVVAGDTLAAAQAHVEERLGVPMQAGGQHAVFGTHNMLLHLEDGIYLEAIAKDPTAQPQHTPCWFDLDAFSGPPRLSSWACRTAHAADAHAQWPEAGDPLALARGDYRWQMFVTENGALPFDNLFPALLSWQGPHPAAALTPQGCRLKRLIVTHPEGAALAARLQISDPRLAFEAGPAGLCAEIATPHGLRQL